MNHYQDAEFARLPREQRSRVELMLRLIANHSAGQSVTKAGGLLHQIQHALNMPYGTARRLYYAYKASGDWRDLMDGRSLRPEKIALDGAKSERFRAWVQTTAERFQRSTKQAIEYIHNAFRYGREVIPGFETWHYGQGRIPHGISSTALRSMIKKNELVAVRLGLRASRRHQLPVLTTRQGLAVGSVYQFDDMWHDHLVIANGELPRVIEFGALDVASACRIHWGHVAHTTKEDGKRQGLTKKMFILFLAYVLRYVGFSANGVQLYMEHGTATVDHQLRELLENAGYGIQVVMGGRLGADQAKLGGYAGASGGNPQTKARIEASHSGLHNLLSNLPGQVGKDRHHMQESTHGREAKQKQVESWKLTMSEIGRHDLAMAMQDHFLTLPQFSTMLIQYYNFWNRRRDHALEGWSDNMAVEYEISEGQWMPASKVTMTPLLREQIALNPAMVREVRLSPAEVWEGQRGDWTHISMALYLDMIGDDKICGHKLRVDRRMLAVQDKLISQDKLYYLAEVVTPEGYKIPLEEGKKYHCILNPYATASLIIMDERGRVIGEAPQYQRVSLADQDAVHEQMGRVMKATLTDRQKQQVRWEADTERARRVQDVNKRIAKTAQPALQTPTKAKAKAKTSTRKLLETVEIPTRKRRKNNLS